MRELNQTDLSFVSGGEGDGNDEDVQILDTVYVTARRRDSDWGVPTFGHGPGAYDSIFGGDFYEPGLGQEGDEGHDEGCSDDVVAYVETGVSIGLGLAGTVTTVETSDGRSFIVIGGEGGVGVPFVEASAGLASSSDNLAGPGFSTGAWLQGGITPTGGNIEISDDAGVDVTWGFETTNATTYPGVMSSDGFAFGPLEPVETATPEEPESCPSEN